MARTDPSPCTPVLFVAFYRPFLRPQSQRCFVTSPAYPGRI